MKGSKEAELLRQLREAAADDLALLARLCERELDREMLAKLGELDFPDGIGLTIVGPKSEKARGLLRRSLTAMAHSSDASVLDELAADYAGIFLTNAYNAPSSESPWMDEDGLERQGPAHEILAWRMHHGHLPEDPLRRPPDFIAFQLDFLSHLMLAKATDEEALREARRFIEAHPALWLPQWAERVANRCATPFYAGLALMIDAYLAKFSEIILDILDDKMSG
jgi:TorA maturation chaperone TorD